MIEESFVSCFICDDELTEDEAFFLKWDEPPIISVCPTHAKIAQKRADDKRKSGDIP